MSVGRKKKPQAIKDQEGTSRKDRTNVDAPKIEAKVLRPPTWMTKEEKTAFRKLSKFLGSKIFVLTEADDLALQGLISNYSIWVECKKAVVDEGVIYESFTENGVIKRKNPKIEIMNQAWDRLGKLLTEFGLTPASRDKVSSIQPEKADIMTVIRNMNGNKPTG